MTSGASLGGSLKTIQVVRIGVTVLAGYKFMFTS